MRGPTNQKEARDSELWKDVVERRKAQPSLGKIGVEKHKGVIPRKDQTQNGEIGRVNERRINQANPQDNERLDKIKELLARAELEE